MHYPRPRRKFLVRLLAPRVSELTVGSAADKKLARALVDVALAGAADAGPSAQALMTLARKLDAPAVATGLRAAAAKLRKTGKHAEPAGLVILRRLGHSADATPEDGYALAAAELQSGRRDEAVGILRQLLDRGFDVPAALRRDKDVDPERRYQIGFQLLEQRHPAGGEILENLARDGGRGKVAQMAKAKLRSAGARD